MRRRGICGTYLALGRQASCIIQEGSPDEMPGWHAGSLGLVNFTTPRISLHEVSKAISLSPMDLVLKPTHLPPASGKCSVCKRKQSGFNSEYYMDLVVKSRSGLTNSRQVQGTSWDPPFLPQEGQLLGLGGKGVWDQGWAHEDCVRWSQVLVWGS